MSENFYDQLFGFLITTFGYLLSSPAYILVWTIICPLPVILYWLLQNKKKENNSNNKIIRKNLVVFGWILSSTLSLALFSLAMICSISLGMWG